MVIPFNIKQIPNYNPQSLRHGISGYAWIIYGIGGTSAVGSKVDWKDGVEVE